MGLVEAHLNKNRGLGSLVDNAASEAGESVGRLVTKSIN